MLDSEAPNMKVQMSAHSHLGAVSSAPLALRLCVQVVEAEVLQGLAHARGVALLRCAALVLLRSLCRGFLLIETGLALGHGLCAKWREICLVVSHTGDGVLWDALAAVSRCSAVVIMEGDQ